MEQCLSLVHQDLMMGVYEYGQSYKVLVKLICLHGTVCVIGASRPNDEYDQSYVVLVVKLVSQHGAVSVIGLVNQDLLNDE